MRALTNLTTTLDSEIFYLTSQLETVKGTPGEVSLPAVIRALKNMQKQIGVEAVREQIREDVKSYAVFFKAGGHACDCTGKEAPFYILNEYRVYPIGKDGGVEHVSSLADFKN